MSRSALCSRSGFRRYPSGWKAAMKASSFASTRATSSVRPNRSGRLRLPAPLPFQLAQPLRQQR